MEQFSLSDDFLRNGHKADFLEPIHVRNEPITETFKLHTLQIIAEFPFILILVTIAEVNTMKKTFTSLSYFSKSATSANETVLI